LLLKQKLTIKMLIPPFPPIFPALTSVSALRSNSSAGLLQGADLAGPVYRMLCSDKSAWHCDELEDFADFYRTGRFRDDDWARNAIAQLMQERGQAFSRCLSGFHYLGRRHDEVEVDFRLAVRGIDLFGP
jgi:hypothetical protein